MKIYIGLLFSILLITGCSSSMSGEDKFSASYIKTHIIPNKTTQAEVKAIYGVPDSQDSDSNGSVIWTYKKDGNLDIASSVANYIPGAGAISGALGMASNASDTATKTSGKLSGDTEHHGNDLAIYINSNNIVTKWLL